MTADQPPGFGHSDPARAEAVQPTRLQLELVPGEEPISGRLIAAGGATSDFVGWLELVRALELASARRGGEPRAPL